MLEPVLHREHVVPHGQRLAVDRTENAETGLAHRRSNGARLLEHLRGPNHLRNLQHETLA